MCSSRPSINAASGLGEARRREGRRARIEHALQVRYGRFGLAKLGGTEDVSAAIDADPTASVERVIDALGRRIERALTQAETPEDTRGA